MIVNKTENGWEIIQHPAHALLAMEIFMELKSDGFTRREKAAVLNALALHDDQEAYYENGSYLSDNGAPLDFTFIPMDAKMRTRQVERIVHSAFLKSTLVGGIIVSHYEHLYHGKPIEEAMQKALHKAKAYINLLSKDEIVDKGRIDELYSTMCFCDRLSLILCQNKVPAMGRDLEIGNLGNEKHYISCVENQINTCHPWPFQENKVKLTLELYSTETLQFESDQELKNLLNDSVPQIKSLKFQK